MILEKIVSIY